MSKVEWTVLNVEEDRYFDLLDDLGGEITGFDVKNEELAKNAFTKINNDEDVIAVINKYKLRDSEKDISILVQIK